MTRRAHGPDGKAANTTNATRRRTWGRMTLAVSGLLVPGMASANSGCAAGRPVIIERDVSSGFASIEPQSFRLGQMLMFQFANTRMQWQLIRMDGQGIVMELVNDTSIQMPILYGGTGILKINDELEIRIKAERGADPLEARMSVQFIKRKVPVPPALHGDIVLGPVISGSSHHPQPPARNPRS